MEAMRQNKVTSKNKKTISIFDLGVQASDMLRNWKELNRQDIQISLCEFPGINFYQIVDDTPLMELILEFVIITEQNKKLLAKKRQAEGIAKARRNGIKLGRRKKDMPKNFEEIHNQVISKKITLKKATEILAVDYKTYKKWVRESSK